MTTNNRKLTLSDMRALPEAPEGRITFCVGPFCWGKDRSPSKAYRKCRENLPGFGAEMGDFTFVEVPATAWLDGMGRLHWEGAGQDALTELGVLTVKIAPAVRY